MITKPTQNEIIAWWMASAASVGAVVLGLLAVQARQKRKYAEARSVWALAVLFLVVALGAAAVGLWMMRRRRASAPQLTPRRSSSTTPPDALWLDLSDGSPPVMYALASAPEGVQLLRLSAISRAGAPVWVAEGIVRDEWAAEDAAMLADVMDAYAYLGPMDEDPRTLGAYALLLDEGRQRALGLMNANVGQYVADLRAQAPLLLA